MHFLLHFLTLAFKIFELHFDIKQYDAEFQLIS